MNNNQALSSPLPIKVLQGVLQYLNEQGYYATHELLCQEANVEYNESIINHQQTYIVNAVSQYVDKQNSFKSTALTQQQLYINTLKAHYNTFFNNNTSHVSIPVNTCISTQSHHTANILSIKLIKPNDNNNSNNQSLTYLSGSVDKSILLVNAHDDSIITRYTLPAPILCIDYSSSKQLTLVGCMNGHSYLIDMHNNIVPTTIQHNTDHNKYIVNAKFNKQSTLYVTASHDMSVKLYMLNNDKTSNYIANIQFGSQVESIEWFADNNQIFVATRENNFIYIIDADKLVTQYNSNNTQLVLSIQFSQLSRYNMNSSGDLHVSFTALNLACSYDGKLLAVATDRHRIIIFVTAMTDDQNNSIVYSNNNDDSSSENSNSDLHTNLLNSAIGLQYSNIYDIMNDGYSSPRLCWSYDSHYLYCTSQNEYTIACFDITNNQRVQTLKGHTSTVRDISFAVDTFNNNKPILSSCSYDKTVKIWTIE